MFLFVLVPSILVAFLLGCGITILVARDREKLSRREGISAARTIARRVSFERMDFEMADAEGPSPARWDRMRSLRELSTEIDTELQRELGK